MNNAEIIRGIDLTLEGLKTIREALANEEVAPKTPTPVQEVEEATVLEGTLEFDVEQLKSMKYNEFKKLAASLGVKCTGTRDEIMARILELNTTVTVSAEDVEEEAEEVVEETPVEEKVSKPNNVKKFEKKVKEPKVEEPKKDEFDEQAEALAEGTSIEDIIEALADVDIKANKKNAVELLAKALREGLIEIEEDEEDESEEEVEEVAEETSEEQDINVNSYFSQFDPEGYNNPEDMTEERAKAIKAKMNEVLTAFYDDELTEEDITSYIEDNATEEEIELLGDDYTSDDILMFYMELIKRTIDNDGEEHEPADPYEVADKDVCCGHELKYIKKTKKYVCEHCGTEYEAE